MGGFGVRGMGWVGAGRGGGISGRSGAWVVMFGV